MSAPSQSKNFADSLNEFKSVVEGFEKQVHLDQATMKKVLAKRGNVLGGNKLGANTFNKLARSSGADRLVKTIPANDELEKLAEILNRIGKVASQIGGTLAPTSTCRYALPISKHEPTVDVIGADQSNFTADQLIDVIAAMSVERREAVFAKYMKGEKNEF
jgi:hypothetical protein